MTSSKVRSGLADARAAIADTLGKLERAAAASEAARALDEARDIRAVAAALNHADQIRLARRPAPEGS